MHLIFFYINHLDQVLRQIFNASAYIYVFVKNTTAPSNTVFIFTDMKLLVIIALGMKCFIACSAAGSYNKYDQYECDEQQQNPILKAKLDALLLVKRLLLGKLLLCKKLLPDGLLGFPYGRYPYGYRYGRYEYGKLGRKFVLRPGIPGKGSYYDLEEQDPTVKGELRKLLLQKKLLLRRILLSRKIKPKYLAKLRKLGKLRYPIWKLLPYLYKKLRYGYRPYGYHKPVKPRKRSYYDMKEQKE